MSCSARQRARAVGKPLVCREPAANGGTAVWMISPGPTSGRWRPVDAARVRG